MGNIIYGLYCPKTKRPVYIGQSTKGLDRPFNHIQNKSHSIKVNDWVFELKESRLSPIIVILEDVQKSEQLNDKEKYWINKVLMEGNLLLNQQSVNPVYFSVRDYNGDSYDFIKDMALFIKYRRKLLKLTQIQLSQKSGISLKTIRAIEQGTKNNFHTAKLTTLLDCFGARMTICSSKAHCKIT